MIMIYNRIIQFIRAQYDEDDPVTVQFIGEEYVIVAKPEYRGRKSEISAYSFDYLVGITEAAEVAEENGAYEALHELDLSKFDISQSALDLAGLLEAPPPRS